MDRLAALTLVAVAACAHEAAAPAQPAEVSPPPYERLAQPSVAACGACHVDVYEEWSATLHARAWTNDNARAATANFTKTECRNCHSPMPVLPTGLDRAPDFRDFNLEDGVHCLSCHGLEGGVAAARTIESAPCRPRRDERLLGANSCYPCHQPTHHAFDEYRVSKAFAAGKRCADCHMPERPGGRHDHGPNGGLNIQFVKQAIRFSGAREDGALVLTVANLTGHKFPGEIPSRSFVLRVEAPGAEARYETLRKPHKGEDRADNRLAPDEERAIRFELGPAAAGAHATLLFKPFPLMPDDAAFVLGVWP